MKLKLLVIALILTVILGTIAFVPMERGDTECDELIPLP